MYVSGKLMGRTATAAAANTKTNSFCIFNLNESERMTQIAHSHGHYCELMRIPAVCAP